MKTVKVAAAVIADDLRAPSRIFAAARGYGEFKGGWEFPGGKIEEGETPREALVREIREELNVEIEPVEWLDTIEYDYPDFHLSMECYWSVIWDGEIVLKEASESRWLTADKLDEVDWLPADRTIIEKVRTKLTGEQPPEDCICDSLGFLMYTSPEEMEQMPPEMLQEIRDMIDAGVFPEDMEEMLRDKMNKIDADRNCSAYAGV